MRVHVLTPQVDAVPGGTCTVELEVFNTGEVIDRVESRVVGTFELTAEQRPQLLSLFPGTGERMTLSIAIPHDYPAGEHEVPLEIGSALHPDEDAEEITVAVAVAPVVAASLSLVPSDITGGRRGKFAVRITNEGNTPLNLALSASDPERALRFNFEPQLVRTEPAHTVYAEAQASGKRPFLGMAIPRQFTVFADGPGVELQTVGRLSQRPWIARGFLTILTLMLVMGLWAVVFTKGAQAVLNREKPKKTVPAGFLVGDQNFSTATVAGSMTGTVTAATDGTPVERITVAAYRLRTGRQELVQSAATGPDGSWKLDAVIPGNYHVKFSAPGFKDTWFPASPTAVAASIVQIRPVAETDKIDVKMEGLPGAVTGALSAGEQSTIAGTVEVRSMAGDVVGPVAGAAATTPDGTFTVGGLPTPATYQLTVTLPGFTQQVVPVSLAGGENQVINTIQMAAAQGAIGGMVTSGGAPVGGVTVTATGAGKTFTTTTPTAGEIGMWSIPGLPTPATYILSFAADGYGTETMALDVGAGQNIDTVDVELTAGTGSISGTVRGPDGKPLGDVTITIGGAAEPITTKTLTSGTIGAYTLTGLTTPGRYTVTYGLDGYSAVTRGVSLAKSSLATGIDVTLTPATGAIAGTVKGGANALAGAVVIAGDGRVDRNTTTADSPAGGYRLDALPPGAYTLKVTLGGYKPYTAIVTVKAGATITTDITLTPTNPGGTATP